MELTLSDDEARTLHDLMSEHLRDIRLEVARTEKKDFRHTLLARQDLVERLVAQLEDGLRPAAEPARRSL